MTIGDIDIVSLYLPHIFVILCSVALIKLIPCLYTFILVWWIGSVVYSLVVNNIQLPPDSGLPWNFSIVATALILLLPSIFSFWTTNDYESEKSSKMIALCNAINIWAVILGSLLIGGSATYYLKLWEPLIVLIFEIIIYGRNSLTSKHARNGIISAMLLVIFGVASRHCNPKKAFEKTYIVNSVIVVISIISVAIKVVLGAKRGEQRIPGRGHILYLDRSRTGFKYVICLAICVIFFNPAVISNVICVFPGLVMMVLAQNIYNYASVEVNDQSLAGEYVNGKIIKRIFVLLALCGQSLFSKNHIYRTNHNERIVLYGAIGRHNFGDILMAEVYEKNLRSTCDLTGFDVFFADILPRNMTRYGGRDVVSITSFMNDMTKTHVVHVGGEISRVGVKDALSMFNPDPNLPELRTSEWQTFVNLSLSSAYIVKKSLFPNPGSFVTNAIGYSSHSKGINKILADFDFVSIRDYPGTAMKKFAPDSVITIKEIFGNKILAHKPKMFSNYIAVQFRGTENVTLVVKNLREIIKATSLGIVFFRAGAAPTHDKLDVYEIALKKMADIGVINNVHIFESLNIWDITSLIANSKLAIATSLHVRIIAFAFSIPRVTFSAEPKHTSMIENWDFGAKKCQIWATDVDKIFPTAMKTMNCDAFRNETYSYRASRAYKEKFYDMIKILGFCNI